jgi:two-component system cell cycle response regulator
MKDPKENRSILVVEPEESVIGQIAPVLEQAGYRVIAARDGFKALAACKVRTPDLIVLDLHMPLMSGRDVFMRLREDEKTRHIPIICLGNEGDAPIQVNLEEVGDQDLLIKPVDPQSLLAHAKALFKVKTLRDELRKKEGQIKELSLTDPVTALRNTRYLTEFLKQEVGQAMRYGAPVSIVVAEIDQHKELSRVHGQKAIDSMAVQVAAIITRQNRQADVCARTGAYEYVLVLPHTQAQNCLEVAERIRQNIAASTFTLGEKILSLTVSIGICQWREGMDNEGKGMVIKARQAVAQAHAQGGNTTIIAS